ncbi:1899_t:CDS:2, partial [Entrophospora sp. SA101]
MIFMRISYKQQTTDPATKNIEKAILTLNNEISKMRTESEWKSETQTLGRTSITSHRSEYSDGTEAIWVEFTYLFNERRKREGRSPATIYNVLSEEIRLGPATLSGFYRHQKKPHVTTLDKIEAWVDKEGKKKDKPISKVENICGEFISNFIPENSSTLPYGLVHAGDWKENEDELEVVTLRILETLRSIWYNPAFRSEFVATMNE